MSKFDAEEVVSKLVKFCKENPDEAAACGSQVLGPKKLSVDDYIANIEHPLPPDEFAVYLLGKILQKRCVIHLYESSWTTHGKWSKPDIQFAYTGKLHFHWVEKDPHSTKEKRALRSPERSPAKDPPHPKSPSHAKASTSGTSRERYLAKQALRPPILSQKPLSKPAAKKKIESEYEVSSESDDTEASQGFTPPRPPKAKPYRGKGKGKGKSSKAVRPPTPELRRSSRLKVELVELSPASTVLASRSPSPTPSRVTRRRVRAVSASARRRLRSRTRSTPIPKPRMATRSASKKATPAQPAPDSPQPGPSSPRRSKRLRGEPADSDLQSDSDSDATVVYDVAKALKKKTRSGRTIVVPERVVGVRKRGPGGEPYKCKKCDLWFRYKSKFDEHRLIHVPSAKFQCTDCTKFFKRRGDLNYHRKTSHPDGMSMTILRCNYQACDFVSKDKKNMSQHKARKHGPPKNCPKVGCDFTFTYHNQLSRHLKKKHE